MSKKSGTKKAKAEPLKTWVRNVSVTPSPVKFSFRASDVEFTNDIFFTPETGVIIFTAATPLAHAEPAAAPSGDVEFTPETGVMRFEVKYRPVTLIFNSPTCSLAAIPDTVEILASFTVKVSLTNPTVAGKSVMLMYKQHEDDEYTFYDTRATDGNGYAWFNGVTLPTMAYQGWDFKAVFYGDEVNEGTESDVSNVTIMDSRASTHLSIRTPTQQWSGEEFVLTATTYPVSDGSPIIFYRSLNNSTWTEIGTALLSAGTSTFTVLENSVISPMIVYYRAAFAGDINLSAATSMSVAVTISTSVQTRVSVKLNTNTPVVRSKYGIIVDVFYVDKSKNIIPLVGAKVNIFTYVATTMDAPITNDYPWMLVDVSFSDIKGRVVLNFKEPMQLRRFIRVVVLNQTLEDIRYNQSLANLVYNVRNPLSLITAPLVGGSVPVIDQVLAARFEYNKAMNQ